MPKVEKELLIAAAPETIWEILSDPHHVPKLYPDMLSIQFEPHTVAVVGQKRTLRGKIGKRLIEFKTQVVEVVPDRRLVITGRRGGAFEEFHQVVELSREGDKTKVKTLYEFKISEAYFGPDFSIPILEQAAIENQDVYLLKMRELAELEPVQRKS